MPSTQDPFRRPIEHDSQCCPPGLGRPHPDIEAAGSSLPGRRGVLTGAAALVAAGWAGPAVADDDVDERPGHDGHAKHGERVRLTVLGTTDLHGNVFNWDSYKNAEYDDKAHNDIGIAKVATLVKAARKELRKKKRPYLLLDAGDTIQGTPLAYYFARVAPITKGSSHPMATAMNLMKYDAAALGNHEFNYGIDTLRAYESQLDF